MTSLMLNDDILISKYATSVGNRFILVSETAKDENKEKSPNTAFDDVIMT